MAFFEIKNVTKKIDNKSILSDVNLKFDSKGLVFIVGKSGAGKSTLLNIIGQIDKEYDGEIFYKGDICQKNERFMSELRRSKIGFIFQDFNLLGDILVSENMELAAGISRSNIISIDEILKIFDIDECKTKQCKVLSGGEKQRVAIARAVCKNSEIILADEPTGNLDEANSKQVFDVLKQISKDRLIIVITHDLEAANKYGDRIISISDGLVVSDEYMSEDVILNNAIDINKLTINEFQSKRIFNPLIKIHLKNNFKRNIMVVIICSILLLFTSLVSGLVNAMQNIKTSINSVFENDKLTIYNFDESTFTSDIISEEFINEINETGCNDIVEYTDINIGYLSGTKIISLNYEVIKNDDFFYNRLKDLGLSMPDSDRKIIINNVLAEQLYNTTECVGKTFYLTAFDENDIECEVYEVADIIDDEKPAIFITDTLLEDLYAKIGDGSHLSMTFSESHNYYAFLNVKSCSAEDMPIIGREPENNNEILINAGGFNSIISILNLQYSAVSVNDLINGNISDETVDAVIGSQISFGIDGNYDFAKDLTIVGITGDCDEKLLVYMKQTALDNLIKLPTYLTDVYLKNLNGNKKTVENIASRYGYTITDKGDFKASLITTRLTVPIVIVSFLSVVAVILAFLFVKLTTKINIMNQSNEIGTLKALGASERQIKSIYLKENIMLFICSMVLTIIILLILQILSVNGILSYQGLEIYDFNFLYFAMICIGEIIVIFIASITEVGKIAKMNLADLLRKSI
jgi:ABC-type lipoprotein export system ATPase subunit